MYVRDGECGIRSCMPLDDLSPFQHHSHHLASPHNANCFSFVFVPVLATITIMVNLINLINLSFPLLDSPLLYISTLSAWCLCVSIMTVNRKGKPSVLYLCNNIITFLIDNQTFEFISNGIRP